MVMPYHRLFPWRSCLKVTLTFLVFFSISNAMLFRRITSRNWLLMMISQRSKLSFIQSCSSLSAHYFLYPQITCFTCWTPTLKYKRLSFISPMWEGAFFNSSRNPSLSFGQASNILSQRLKKSHNLRNETIYPRRRDKANVASECPYC